MTRADPNRTPCEEDFAAAIGHFAVAGACRIVSRRSSTDANSAFVLTETAAERSADGHRLLRRLFDPQPRHGGSCEVR
jgi:hypothetical protein